MTGKGPIPVREVNVSGTAEVLSVIQGATEPMVFRGACRSWPLVQAGLESENAAIDYLRRMHADVLGVTVETPPSERGRLSFNDTVTGFNFQHSMLPIGQLLDTIQAENAKSDPRGLYAFLDLRQVPGLAAENGSEFDALGGTRALIVSNRACTPAHFDFPNNLPCNLVGERTFTIFPTDQVKNLYTGPLGMSPSGHEVSMVDFRAVDVARFPKAATALDNAQQVRLKPGDILFLPSMWWHHIDVHSNFNILMPQWWRSGPEWLGQTYDALRHAVLCIRDLPKSQRQAWKALFEHYVFDHDDHFPEHLPPAVRGPLASPMTEESAKSLRADLASKLQPPQAPPASQT